MTFEGFEFLFDVLDGEKCSLSCRELLGRIGRHLFLSPGFGFAFFRFNISLFPIFPGLSELIFSYSLSFFLLKIQLFTGFLLLLLSQIMLFLLFSKLWHKATFSAMAILATYPLSSLKNHDFMKA